MEENIPQDPRTAGLGHQGEPAEGWIDRLVELHVLSDNGDVAAAATAQRWLAQDAEARRVWDSVQQTCDQLRGHTPSDRGDSA